MSDNDPYSEGVDAYHNGEDLDIDNPYIELEGVKWSNGWENACMDAGKSYE